MLLPNTVDEVTQKNFLDLELLLNWVKMNFHGLSLGWAQAIGRDDFSPVSTDFIEFMISSLESSLSDLEYWYRLASEGKPYD